MRPMIAPVLAMLLAALGGAVPGELTGWKADGAPARYDAATIFDYIDGHGEIYLAYGMRSCVARRFKGPPGEGEILVDLFEMGSADDAYGIFTHAREGEPAGVGEESSFGAGTLAFWKGSMFVSITAERSTERSRGAALAFGRAEAARIATQGPRPALVGYLPRNGLDDRSIVYLRHPIILAAHLDVGSGNPLGVGPAAPAALGRYRRAGSTGWTLVVQHRSDPEAEAALEAFSAAILEKGGATRRGEVWWAAGRTPRSEEHRVVVTRASTKELAQALLEEGLRSHGGER
jgi:hypothetical protein